MGDPVTATIIISALLQSYSTVKQGQAEKAIAKTQQREAEMKAQQTSTNAQIVETNRKRKAQQIISSQNALFSARGVRLDSGTPFALAQQVRAEDAEIGKVLKTEADINRTLFEMQATQSKIAAKTVKFKTMGKLAGIAMGTTSSLSSSGGGDDGDGGE